MSSTKQFIFMVVLILWVAIIFSLPFFLTSAAYQVINQQPSPLLSYLINVLLGCSFILGLATLWKRFSEADERAAYIEILRPITEGMERIARGDFYISIASDAEGDVFTSELAKSVNRTALELQQMEQMRQEFISTISHEIQSPLTSMRGFAQVLQNEDLNSEDRRHYLDIIDTETRRLSRLTENLLKLASLDAKQMKFEPKPYRLDKQLRNLILACEPQWHCKTLEIDLIAVEVTIRADEDLLSQVWLNLIYNSIKFTPQAGRVSITLHQEDDTIQFEIRDTGIGIADKDQARIFERFYKADRSRTRSDNSGSGLGLAIARKIVELHNGVITVESTLGAGSSFKVTLPA